MAYKFSKGTRGLGDITFEDDADTGIDFEPDTIKLETGGAERLVVTNTGAAVTGDISVTGEIKTPKISFTDGDDAITIEDGGYLKVNAGIKYNRSVQVGTTVSPSASGGNLDGGWIKFATFNCPGTSNLDTAASTFLVTLAGFESSSNRKISGLFMVHARFTNNNAGNGNGASDYYDSDGTYLYCEPWNADQMSGTGANAPADFDPATDLLMIFTNDDTTPVVDLYIKACAKDKICFVTHLGSSSDTSSTDAGWDINTGQSWSATEPAAPGGSVKKTGTWVSKIFSNATIKETLTVKDTLETKAVKVQVRDVDTTSTIQTTDYVLRCIQTSDITLTLPPKSGNAGRILIFKDINGNAGSPSSHTVTLDGDSSDTIDGSATYVVDANKESVTLTCDGINGWMLTSRIVP